MDAKAHGDKGISGTVYGRDSFFCLPSAAGKKSPLSLDQAARIVALNDDGKTVSVLLIGGTVAVAVAMRDEPRTDAKARLKLLADKGIKIVMLTGDNRRMAEAINRQFSIEAGVTD